MLTGDTLYGTVYLKDREELAYPTGTERSETDYILDLAYPLVLNNYQLTVNTLEVNYLSSGLLSLEKHNLLLFPHIVIPD